MNDLGYSLKRVIKTKPIKKIPETEAIFKQVTQINTESDRDPNTLRISIDAKAAVKVGEFDRGGKSGSPGFMVDTVSDTTVRDSVMPSESRICGLFITTNSGEPAPF